MKTFSIKEALTQGWEILKKHFWFVIGTTFIYSLFNINFNLSGDNKEWSVPDVSMPLLVLVIGVIVLVAIVFWILQTIVQIGYYRIYLKLLEGGERPKFGELFSNRKPFWRYVGSTILYCLRVFVGFLLLIIPGIIWALKFQFMPILTVDKGLKPTEAMKESARMTEGHKWHLFKFWAFIIALNFLGFVCLFVGLLVTIPVSTLAYLHIYKKLL